MSEAPTAALRPSGDAGERLLQSPAPAAALGVVLVALAFAVLPLAHAVVAAFTAAVLIVLSAVDIERGIIPNRIVLPAGAFVLVAQIALSPDRAPEWALAAVFAALFFLLPHLLSGAWMGMGDVKLALLLGAALGWQVAGAIVLAFLCVFPVALLILVRGGLAARKTTLPFGPFLSLGALIMLFGPPLAGFPVS
jgi:leader peptidase (prepilin peptidase)/N-methyltransferase